MTAEEHFREAERLIEQARQWADEPDMTPAEQIARRMADLDEAQVHATLYRGAAATGPRYAPGAPSTKLIPGGQYL